MKAGYKHTDVGVIPEDWDALPLGSSTEFKNGLNKAKIFFGHGTPIVNYMDVFKHSGLHQRDIAGLVSVTTDEQNAYSARKGDVFFTRTSETVDEIGVSAVLLEDIKKAVFSGFILRGRDKAGTDGFHLDFKKYCFSSEPVRKQIRSSASYTTRALTNGNLLAKVMVPTPRDTEEQKAIAGALSDVDGLIAGLEALIAKKRSLKTATMQQLLTGKTRLPGFGKGVGMKQTELGEIPEDWGIFSIGDLAATPLQNGVFFEGKRKGRGAAMINVGDLYKSSPIAVSSLEKFDASNSEIARFAVKTGDLFFTRSSIVPSGIAYCNWLGDLDEKTVVFDSHIVRFNPNREKVVPSYIYSALLMRKSREQLVANAKTATMTTIDQAGISMCKVAVPSIEEQLSISDVLTHFDLSISTLEGRLCKTKALKQGMMQELLTGRTRLI